MKQQLQVISPDLYHKDDELQDELEQLQDELDEASYRSQKLYQILLNEPVSLGHVEGKEIVLSKLIATELYLPRAI